MSAATTLYETGTQRSAALPNNPDQLRLKYIDNPPSSSSSSPKGTILLIHGFPQTSYQFRKVLPLLATGGYRVIAPDYRGAGDSTKPVSGYTKTVMAADLHSLLQDVLGITEPVHVVGHDIGGMVAHAYAASFPKDTASVVWGECPLPGSTFYEENKTSPLLWHFVFHKVPDLPETLIAGNERAYLKNFYDRFGYNPAGVQPADLEYYASVYAQPGAVRAGLNTYRAFEEDGVENKKIRDREGKCKVRSLVFNGDHSFTGSEAEKMGREFYEDVQVAEVKESGHWIAEENPQGFVDGVLGFIEKK